MWVWLQDNDGTKYNNSNLWMLYENYQRKNKQTRKRRPNVSYSVWTWNDHVIYSLQQTEFSLLFTVLLDIHLRLNFETFLGLAY